MDYKFPKTELLSRSSSVDVLKNRDLAFIEKKILETLKLWDISASIEETRVTPLAICYDFKPKAGTTSVKNFPKIKTDLEVRIGADVEIITNRDVITITVLPEKRQFIRLRNLIESDEFKNAQSPMTVAVGIDYAGHILTVDIAELPHMLIAGTTGSGKTIFLNDIILSILYKARPEQVQMILVDPKKVDLISYSGLPHLLSPVVYDAAHLVPTLDYVVSEAQKRLNLFASCGVKNIEDYNKSHDANPLPRILVIIDEYSEFMDDYRLDFEAIIDSICSNGRIVGIHMVIATQRPTAKVMTAGIKSNFLCRASFAVVDSKTSMAIFDTAEANKLCGSGDMLFAITTGAGTRHAQAPLVTESEKTDVIVSIRDENKNQRLY